MSFADLFHAAVDSNQSLTSQKPSNLCDEVGVWLWSSQAAGDYEQASGATDGSVRFNLVFGEISEKLDAESRKQWQLNNPGTDLLSWTNPHFLDTRSRALECGDPVKAQTVASNKGQKQGSGRARTVQGYQTSIACGNSYSDNRHFHAYLQFRKMSVTDRFNLVKRKGACFNLSVK